MPYIFAMLIFFIVFVDRWTKRKTIEILGSGSSRRSVELIENKLRLMIEDSKSSTVDGLNNKISILIKITLIFLISASIYLITLMQYQGDIGLKLALSFIIGGGCGNFIDRVGYGYVIDFICIRGTRDIVFNLSRIFTITGIVLLIFNI